MKRKKPHYLNYQHYNAIKKQHNSITSQGIIQQIPHKGGYIIANETFLGLFRNSMPESPYA